MGRETASINVRSRGYERSARECEFRTNRSTIANHQNTGLQHAKAHLPFFVFFRDLRVFVMRGYVDHPATLLPISSFALLRVSSCASCLRDAQLCRENHPAARETTRSEKRQPAPAGSPAVIVDQNLSLTRKPRGMLSLWSFTRSLGRGTALPGGSRLGSFLSR